MDSLKLTPREVEILVAFVREARSDVDWTKVAAATNCKTAKYARDKFALIRNKIFAAFDGNANGTTAADGDGAAGKDDNGTPNGKANKAKTITPRKPKRKNADTDADDEESPATKKSAIPRAKTSKLKQPVADEGEVAVKDEPNEAGAMMDDMIW